MYANLYFFFFDRKSSFFYINCFQNSRTKTPLIFLIKFLTEKTVDFSLGSTYHD